MLTSASSFPFGGDSVGRGADTADGGGGGVATGGGAGADAGADSDAGAGAGGGEGGPTPPVAGSEALTDVVSRLACSSELFPTFA